MKFIKTLLNRFIILKSILYNGFIRGYNVRIIGNFNFGSNVVIGDYTSIISSDDGKIFIDNSTSIGRDSWIASGNGEIIIKNECIFGPRVTIVAQNHGSAEIKSDKYLPWDLDSIGMKTSIGSRCHLGANVTILPGTKLGDYCVVAANSLVSGTYKNGSIIGGNPSKLLKIRKIPKKINNNSNIFIPPYIHTSNKFF